MNDPNEHTPISFLKRLQADPTNDAWRKFVEMYEPMIVRFLNSRGVRPQDIDDVRQEVMALLLQTLPSFDHNGRTGAFRRWLRITTAHRLRTARRREWRSPVPFGGEYEVLAAGLEDDSNEIAREWDREHDRHVLSQLLAEIPDKKSVRIFRRVDLDGQSVEEVALEFGVSTNAVAIARSRVLTKLRTLAEGLVGC
jgi:RNA polymerase sigma factor (sigma-70 family)